MKNKVLSMLVLLMTAVSGAWAQSTYKVTMKEGTVDAEKWTITPNPATAGTQVTATYSGTKRVKSVKAKKVNPLATPLTIEALDNYSSITVSNPKPGMKYSTDGGMNKYEVPDIIFLEHAGDKVQFYGNTTSYDDTNIGGSGKLKVYGNIMSLINETDFATEYTTLPANNTFRRLFRDNTSLTDASGLLLPATTLTNYCYGYMFYRCTNLTAGPTLPATTLTEDCYYNMFFRCESLTSLTCLATNISAPYCISNWLYDVKTTGTLYVDETMTGATWNQPSSWSVVAKP